MDQFPTYEEVESLRSMARDFAADLRDSRTELDLRWVDGFLSRAHKKYKSEVFDNFPDFALNYRRIQTQFVSDLRDRPKLHSEGGVIFANHPGGLWDVAIVLQALQNEQRHIRDDLKILVDPAYFPAYSENLGSKHFLPATDNAKEVTVMFDDVAKFVNGGGAFLIFPSDRLAQRKGTLKFKNGLAYLLERLDPKKMAYSFFIDPKQVNKGGNIFTSSVATKAIRATEALSGNRLIIPKPKVKYPVSIAERYESCEELQSVMAPANGQRGEESKLLLEHFLTSFKDYQE